MNFQYCASVKSDNNIDLLTMIDDEATHEDYVNEIFENKSLKRINFFFTQETEFDIFQLFRFVYNILNKRSVDGVVYLPKLWDYSGITNNFNLHYVEEKEIIYKRDVNENTIYILKNCYRVLNFIN